MRASTSLAGRKAPVRPAAGAASRILLQDYCGHPFQLQLAEELAARGHDVVHVYCASNPGTPHALDRSPDETTSLRVRAIALSRPISKGAFVQRLMLEREYGDHLARLIVDERPDVVILANTPVDALARAVKAARSVNARLVIWVQDLLGEAALRILSRKIGPAGRLVGSIYRKRESALLARADHLVAITDDFGEFFDSAGIPRSRWTTIPNWAPLDKIAPCAKDNDWARAQGIDEKVVFLYSGSLGFKHNPRLLLSLAQAIRNRDDAVIVVNSEGAAADWLKAKAAEEGFTNRLRVNGYQPFERITEVLGAADVLVALLERDAGVFSVPSKVLSNHCAGRPQLLAVPPDNLAAKIVAACESGFVSDPQNERAFVENALELLDNRDMREIMGQNARRYAQENFQIERIADRFEEIIRTGISNPREMSGSLA